MRRVVVLLLICFAFAATAQPVLDCNPVEQLRTYLVKRHSNVDQNGKPVPRQILALDHKTRRWSGYSWDGSSGLVATSAGFEDMSLAKPRVIVGKAQPLVVVINTNPLLYSTRQTAATRVDTADLEALQQLALSLGGVLTFAVEAGGQRDILEAIRASEAPGGDPANALKAMEKVAVTPAQLDELADAFIAALDEQSKALATPLADVKSTTTNLKALVDTATRQEAGLNSLIQVVESGQNPTPVAEPAQVDLPQRLEEAFGNVITARDTLKAVESLCAEEAAHAVVAIGHKRFGFPTDPRLREAAIEQFDEARAALEGAGSKTCDRTPRDAMRALGRWLAQSPPRVGQEAPAGQQKDLKLMEDAALRYGTALAKSSAAAAKVNEVLQNRFASVKASARVAAIAQIRKHHDTGDPCSLTAGVVELDRPVDPLSGIPFGKEGNERSSCRRAPRSKTSRKATAIPWRCLT